MKPKPIVMEIMLYKDSYRPQVIAVWEASVLATHQFLHPDDFSAIKALVSGIDFNSLQVYCLIQNDNVLGFVGVADKKVEMLFVAPDCIGKGLGKQLLQFAISDLNADTLDVNEQNTAACGFYLKQGFKPYERTERDDQGRRYPLLRMRLKKTLN